MAVDGILVVSGVRATLGQDGLWQSDDLHLERMLNDLYPPPATEQGDPVCVAFATAVEGVGAVVLRRPEPEEWEGIS